MEEMMMVMMKIKSQETSPKTNTILQSQHNLNIPMITSPISPAWKLYENPIYMISHHQQQQDSIDHHNKQIIHKLHLPISARKISTSFWDLSFIKPLMESERARITELKAEVECERKARKKMETLNKRLAREVAEERRGREALERVCEELAKEISSDKSEISRMRKEMDDERKMMRTAQVIREERVQMKLAEAKFLMEEKLEEMEITRKNNVQTEASSSSAKKHLETSREGDHAGIQYSMALMQRKSFTETENPHIKRGIKGFVEFPKVIRAIGCRSSKHLGTKLECQKAQLKILLKQKGAVRFNGLIAR